MARQLRITIGGRELVAHVDKGVVRFDGVEGAWAVARGQDGRLTVTAEGTPVRMCAARTPAVTWVGVDGRAVEVQVASGRARARAGTADADALRPPMSATVVRLMTSEGASVAEGDTLVVLEAMKMEMPIRAPRAGTVTRIHCREGELVQPSTVLVDLE
ncbi:MAG: hypothetical protein AMXMBFR57_33580 [Acidimicrobiia bacterium]